HHDVVREERAVAGDAGRDDPHAPRGVVPLEGDLVAVLEGADLDRLHLPDPEVVEDRSLDLLVHDPLALDLLGDAELAAIECGDDVLGRHRTSSRIAAARSHSFSLGTRAIRT